MEILLTVAIVTLARMAFGAPATASCPSAMFWFGDSFADTGNFQATTPFVSAAEYTPYGMTHFGSPSNRYSDGRLLVDFFARTFRYNSSPSPRFQSFNSDYKQGVNFAASGATALNTSYVVPFYLPVQVDQYLQFVKNAHHLQHHRYSHDALYAIVIGTNDLLAAHLRERHPENTTAVIVPQVIAAISYAVETLYNSGARNFMIFNTFPHGCMPLLLNFFKDLPKDSRGCLRAFNKVAESLNLSLYNIVAELRSKLRNSILIYADVYNFTVDVLDQPSNFGKLLLEKNPSRFRSRTGFKNETKMSACCGGGGDYNFNSTKLCGLPVQPDESTLNPSEFISWDGIHYTDAFYGHLSEALLAGKYLTPSLDFSKSCKLGSE